MIKCLIVEDEPLAQDIIAGYIKRTKQLECVGICRTALGAFSLLQRGKIELMFLDVKMPGINGLDFLKSLAEPPAVIFTTAFSEYAVDGFELEAVDYLLKPITFERFTKSIQKLLKVQTIEQELRRNYSYFKVSGKLIKLSHSDILYAQSIKDYIRICTVDKSYLTHMTMKYLCELLPAETFTRVHRSYLVNKNYITEVSRTVIKIREENFPIGENYKLNLDSLN